MMTFTLESETYVLISGPFQENEPKGSLLWSILSDFFLTLILPGHVICIIEDALRQE